MIWNFKGQVGQTFARNFVTRRIFWTYSPLLSGDLRLQLLDRLLDKLAHLGLLL
jgi:hypothetical protein